MVEALCGDDDEEDDDGEDDGEEEEEREVVSAVRDVFDEELASDGVDPVTMVTELPGVVDSVPELLVVAEDP